MSFSQKEKHERDYYIQKIVQSNQQMIHQQIKLIKTLQSEKENLQHKYQQLKNKYQQLQCKTRSDQDKVLVDISMQTQNLQEQRNLSELSPTKSLQSENKNNSKIALEKRNRKHPQINKQNIHQFIPMVMIRKNQEFLARTRRNSYQEENNTQYWLKQLQNSHNSQLRFRQKTLNLSKKGIPHQIRHKVWPVLQLNKLAITNQLYFELLQRKNNGWLPIQVKSQIEKDINRSFNGRIKHQGRVNLKLQVSQVLQLFHIYRPDISYVQGMTYPTIVLALVTGKTIAFNIFSNFVLANQLFKKLFSFQSNFVNILCRTFEILLSQYCPNIAQKLLKQKIESQIFLVEWFFTVFSRSLSFQGTLKFWDQLFYWGQVTLFRMALSIFQIIQPWLMETNYEETVGLIKGFEGYTNQAKLLECLAHHKLTDEKMNKVLRKVQRSITNRKWSE